jgi:hypothetical protein
MGSATCHAKAARRVGPVCGSEAWSKLRGGRGKLQAGVEER